MLAALFALGTPGGSIGPVPPTAPSASGWQLVFSDDFKSKRLDASKWFPGLWYAVGNPPTSSDKLFTAFTPAQA